jgi:hypothetical protein
VRARFYWRDREGGRFWRSAAIERCGAEFFTVARPRDSGFDSDCPNACSSTVSSFNLAQQFLYSIEATHLAPLSQVFQLNLCPVGKPWRVVREHGKARELSTDLRFFSSSHSSASAFVISLVFP